MDLVVGRAPIPFSGVIEPEDGNAMLFRDASIFGRAPTFNRSSYGEIRAFTNEEIAAMQTAVDRTQAAIDSRQSDLEWKKANLLNWIGAASDIVTNLQNELATSQKALDNLVAVRDAVVESGDTDRYNGWMAAVADVGGFSAYDKALTMTGAAPIVEPLEQTAEQVGTTVKKAAGGFGLGLGMVLGIGFVLWLLTRKK